MGKNLTSKEAYVQRIQQLADVNNKKKKINESRVVGTLIDFKRSSDGTAYGVVKENKKYYIKKAGLNENLGVADFVYIGGLGNITQYQYNTINEATKNRDLLVRSINEGYSNSNYTKDGRLIIKEESDKAKENIEKADSVIDDLETATKKEKEVEIAPEPELEPDFDVDTMNMGEPDMGDDNQEMSTDDNEGVVDGDDSEDAPVNIDIDDLSDPTKEVESKLGKITNQIRKMELTPTQVKSYVNTFLSAFKDAMPEVEIEDRKTMANKILKVVDDSETDDIDVDDEMNENEKCSECGEFTSYVESLGYDKESISSCDIEEMANVISGYANAHTEGLNEGDFENVSLFTNDEINEKLIKEYGHEDFVKKMNEYYKKINEYDTTTKQQKIDELNWGGLKNVGKAIAGDIGRKASQYGSDIKKSVGDKWDSAKEKAIQAGSAAVSKVGQVYSDVTNKLDDLSTKYSQIYNKAEFNTHLKELEKMAEKMGKALDQLNQASVKAGNGEINVGSVMSTISNQIRKHGKADLTTKQLSEININEIDGDDELEVVDFDGNLPTEINSTEPQMNNNNSIDVQVDGQNKTINIAMNEGKLKNYIKQRVSEIKEGKASLNESKKSESLRKLDEMIKVELKEYETEMKLRRYVKNRLEEITGKRKPSLNESKKSESLRKLDKMIERQYRLMENAQQGDEMLDEGIIDDVITNFINLFKSKSAIAKDKLLKIDTDDAGQVEKLFRETFGDIINSQSIVRRAVNEATIEEMLEIIKQFIENKGGGIVARLDSQKKPVGLIYLKPSDYEKRFKYRSTGGSGGQNV